MADDTKAREHFSIDPKNGSLYLMTDVDREVNDRYEAKVRVDRVKIGRGMPVMIYPVVGERLNGLAPNEARVVVRVKDVNDNAPRFKSKGRPILAAIPTAAHYGYEVVKVEVRLHAPCCALLCVHPLRSGPPFHSFSLPLSTLSSLPFIHVAKAAGFLPFSVLPPSHSLPFHYGNFYLYQLVERVQLASVGN